MTDTAHHSRQVLIPLVLVPGPGRHDASQLARFIRAHATVTAALERWCLLAGIGTEPIVARIDSINPVAEPHPKLPDGLEAALQLAPGRPIICRKVALLCGPVVLMEALNWYVPDRLPADVASSLETSNVPFGRAVETLGVHRLDVRDIEAQPGELFAQQAIVCDRAGIRLAVVVERFLPALLARHAA